MAQQQTREEPRGQEKQGASGNKKSRDRQDLGRKPGSHKNLRAKKGWWCGTLSYGWKQDE